MRETRLFDESNLKKMRVSSCTWDEIFENPKLVYEAIIDLLLDSVNLFYFASQKESTKTLTETKKYIKVLLKNGTIDDDLNAVLDSIGWNKEQINVQNTIFQGDLAEYLMCILIDELTDYNTLISKVSLKTSPKMPSFGNDNIFFDYDNNILYYGESKFYADPLSGVGDALKSLDIHFTTNEISYIRSHTRTFIAPDGKKRKQLVEMMDFVPVDDINIKRICFVANDTVCRKEDYENLLMKKFGNQEEITNTFKEIVLVFLPVISKKELLEHFERRITNENG